MNDVICLQCQNGEILLIRSAAESALQFSIDRPSLGTKHASLSNCLHGRHEIATCCDKASVTQRELSWFYCVTLTQSTIVLFVRVICATRNCTWASFVLTVVCELRTFV